MGACRECARGALPRRRRRVSSHPKHSDGLVPLAVESRSEIPVHAYGIGEYSESHVAAFVAEAALPGVGRFKQLGQLLPSYDGTPLGSTT